MNKRDENLCLAETNCENSSMSKLYAMKVNKCLEKENKNTRGMESVRGGV